MKTVDGLIKDVVKWIDDYCTNSHVESLIVGVSGGIDSAVVERLCEKTGRPVYCYSLPLNPACIQNFPASTSSTRAIELCQGSLNNNRIKEFDTIFIGSIVKAYKELGLADSQLGEGNLRSRIRANILYDKAGKHNGIVVGTGNLDEDYIGYFTKGGDGLVDICPISSIHKSVVYKMAKKLGVPKSIIDAVPTAELWDGQTDEDELGMTYNEIEEAIKRMTFNYDADTDEMNERQRFVFDKVMDMHIKNRHKLRYPPIFDPLGSGDWSF